MLEDFHIQKNFIANLVRYPSSVVPIQPTQMFMPLTKAKAVLECVDEQEGSEVSLKEWTP